MKGRRIKALLQAAGKCKLAPLAGERTEQGAAWPERTAVEAFIRCCLFNMGTGRTGTKWLFAFKKQHLSIVVKGV